VPEWTWLFAYFFTKIGTPYRERILITCSYYQVYRPFSFLKYVVINLWFLARQPASPWQTFCALLVAASSLCCYRNMKLMGLPSAELLHFLFEYVTWLLNLHVQLCATGVYVCKTLQAHFRAAAIRVRTEENVLMMWWIILIIACANSRFMVTTVKVSIGRSIFSSWTLKFK